MPAELILTQCLEIMLSDALTIRMQEPSVASSTSKLVVSVLANKLSVAHLYFGSKEQKEQRGGLMI